MRETRGSEGGCCYVDGNRDYTATTLIFVNDALTDYRIWKPLVQELGDRYPEWRFVRYGELFSNLISAYVLTLLTRIINMARRITLLRSGELQNSSTGIIS